MKTLDQIIEKKNTIYSMIAEYNNIIADESYSEHTKDIYREARSRAFNEIAILNWIIDD